MGLFGNTTPIRQPDGTVRNEDPPRDRPPRQRPQSVAQRPTARRWLPSSE